MCCMVLPSALICVRCFWLMFQAFSDERHRRRYDLHILRSLQRAGVLAHPRYVFHHAVLHHHETADQGSAFLYQLF